MKYICFIFGCLFLSVEYSNSQVITFEKNYGFIYDQRGKYILQTPEGNYVIASNTYSDNSGVNKDVVVFSIDTLGKVLWERKYDFKLNDYTYGIRMIGNNELIMDITSHNNDISKRDTRIVKLDFNGDTLWIKKYDCNPNFSPVNAVIPAYDGGFMVACESGSGIFVVKFNSMGDSLWAKQYSLEPSPYGNYIEQTADSGYILIGYYSGGAFLLKLNITGDSLWAKTYDKAGNFSINWAFDVETTYDGGFIITGETYNTPPDWQGAIFLIKTDENGDTLWTNAYGGTSDFSVSGVSVRQTNDSGYVISGTRYYPFPLSYNEIFLLKTDKNGDTLWTRTFEGVFDKADDWAWCVQQTADGGYIMAGERFISDFTGKDIYVIKTDSLGKVYPPDTTTNIAAVKNENYTYKIYPNPNQGNFTLVMASFDQNNKRYVYVYNTLGELVYENESIKNTHLNIDISEQPKGIYLIKVMQGNEVFTDKIIYQ